MTKAQLANLSVFASSLRAASYICCPRYISYSIHCCRTLVLDSRHNTDGTGGVVRFGGDLGQIVELPCNVVIWGDVRLKFYQHSTVESSQRMLIFFVVLNTAFYANEKRIVISKRYIDMMHKDAQNKVPPFLARPPPPGSEPSVALNTQVCDADFQISLKLDPDIGRSEHLLVWPTSPRSPASSSTSFAEA